MCRRVWFWSLKGPKKINYRWSDIDFWCEVVVWIVDVVWRRRGKTRRGVGNRWGLFYIRQSYLKFNFEWPWLWTIMGNLVDLLRGHTFITWASWWNLVALNYYLVIYTIVLSSHRRLLCNIIFVFGWQDWNGSSNAHHSKKSQSAMHVGERSKSGHHVLNRADCQHQRIL